MLRTPFPILRTPFSMLRIPFPMLRTLFPCYAPPSSPDIVYMLRVMLRVCGEHVASLWRACCDQHTNIVLRTLFHVVNSFSHVANTFSMLRPPPSSPDIVYILRAMLRACGEHVASTIQTSDAKLVGGWEGVRFFPRSDV
jgi:hypothetical protein